MPDISQYTIEVRYRLEGSQLKFEKVNRKLMIFCKHEYDYNGNI